MISLSWFCKWRKEKKKGAKCEINKIIGYTSTVIIYIYMHGYYSKCINIHNFRRD